MSHSTAVIAAIGNINDWAGAIGGTILGIELIILLLLIVAVNAGLAFGLWWVLRKMGWVHAKSVWARGLIDKYVERGVGIAAAPVIRTTSGWRGLKAGLHRATHWPPRSEAAPPTPLTAPAPPAPGTKDPSRAA